MKRAKYVHSTSALDALFIGNDCESEETLQEIFDSGTTTQVVINPKKRTSFASVPLQRAIEDKLYPDFRSLTTSLILCELESIQRLGPLLEKQVSIQETV